MALKTPRFYRQAAFLQGESVSVLDDLGKEHSSIFLTERFSCAELCKKALAAENIGAGC